MNKTSIFYIKDFFKIWCQKEGWIFILISWLGNSFPIWFKTIICYIKGEDMSTIINNEFPFTILLISISFSSMTIYLWLKNIKFERNSSNLSKQDSQNNLSGNTFMIIYILLIFPLWGFLIANENMIKLDLGRYSCCIYIFAAITLLVYTHFQLKDFFEEDKVKTMTLTTIPKEINSEIENLNNDLNKKI